MNLKNLSKQDTIIAPATAPGMGAIAVIRISGPKAITVTDKFFCSFKKGKKLSSVKTHTANFGEIKDGDLVIDEVLVNIFHDGKSFTGEETVEISCHGSTYITQKIIPQIGGTFVIGTELRNIKILFLTQIYQILHLY